MYPGEALQHRTERPPGVPEGGAKGQSKLLGFKDCFVRTIVESLWQWKFPLVREIYIPKGNLRGKRPPSVPEEGEDSESQESLIRGGGLSLHYLC